MWFSHRKTDDMSGLPLNSITQNLIHLSNQISSKQKNITIILSESSFFWWILNQLKNPPRPLFCLVLSNLEDKSPHSIAPTWPRSNTWVFKPVVPFQLNYSVIFPFSSFLSNLTIIWGCGYSKTWIYPMKLIWNFFHPQNNQPQGLHNSSQLKPFNQKNHQAEPYPVFWAFLILFLIFFILMRLNKILNFKV